MANVEAAREEIHKVITFFVTRFGSRAEVFDHLTRALGYLTEPAPAPVPPEPVVIVEPEEVPEPGPFIEEPIVEEPIAPRPTRRRRRK
jgi:hypothetical protein